MKAIVFGATGETGRQVVKLLERQSPEVVEAVRIFARHSFGSPVGVKQNFDEVILEDFFRDLEAHKNELRGFDVAFCALGTTRAKAGSAENFRAVDFGLIVKIAQLCKEAQIRDFHLVSAANANKNSWFLYPQVKGETESIVKKIGLTNLSIYQPAMLLASREECRPVECGWQKLMAVDFRNWMSIPVKVLAAAMVDRALNSETYGQLDMQNVSHAMCVLSGTEALKRWNAPAGEQLVQAEGIVGGNTGEQGNGTQTQLVETEEDNQEVDDKAENTENEDETNMTEPENSSAGQIEVIDAKRKDEEETNEIENDQEEICQPQPVTAERISVEQRFPLAH